MKTREVREIHEGMIEISREQGKDERAIPEIQFDTSISQPISMPNSLKILCKKYGISPTECVQEGALMLLAMNEDYMASEGRLEEVYRQIPSKYRAKVNSFVQTIQKITGGK